MIGRLNHVAMVVPNLAAAARAYAEAARQSIAELPQTDGDMARALRALKWVPGYETDRDR